MSKSIGDKKEPMKIRPIFIGITGGSGAGKSTLCTLLQEKYPDQIGLIQLDDYFKSSKESPKFKGYTNFEHPDCVYWSNFIFDLTELFKGNSIVVNTKNGKINPEFKNTNKKIPIEIQARPIIFVEGYLVLWNEVVRKLFRESIWLEVDHKIRWERRVHFKDSEYEKDVLIPMHKQFVESTKKYAEHVIDVSDLSKEQVLEVVERIVFH